MKHYILYDHSGQIKHAGGYSAGEGQRDPPLAYGGLQVLFVEGPVDPRRYCVAGGVLRELPPKPSALHRFDYQTKRWDLDSAAAWEQVKFERNGRLERSDWTQLPDVPIATREAWAAYRQALRDITQQSNPLQIEWPNPPSK